MQVLVTDGISYIWSHTIVDLLENNYKVVFADNLVNYKRLYYICAHSSYLLG